MNISLLLKWWWKLKNNVYTSLWKQILLHKYVLHPTTLPSPFWKSLSKIASFGDFSISYKLGIQTQIRFWDDQWYQNCFLAVRYYSLYQKCTTKHVLLAYVINSQGQNLKFRVTLVGIDYTEWTELLHLISSISFSSLLIPLSGNGKHQGSFPLTPFIIFLILVAYFLQRICCGGIYMWLVSCGWFSHNTNGASGKFSTHSIYRILKFSTHSIREALGKFSCG
jgi:hypothetical protein